MGKILQIQVRAWTYDENEVTRTWPRLTGLVWSESSKWAPAGQKHGVIELVKALPDVVDFGELPSDLKSSLKPKVAALTELDKKLEQALADWQPTEANRLSDQLEDALTDLERNIPAPTDN